MKKNIANFITSIRIFGAIALFFVEPLSKWFFAVFLFCGLSDAVDGFVARKFQITSEFGSKLDSVADLSFYSAMMIVLLNDLRNVLWGWLWIVLFAILLIRLTVYLISAFRFGKFSSLHTILNKATGVGMFLLPVFLICKPIVFNIYSAILCAIAIVAAVQELLFYLKIKEEK
ncbi:MAG: CDP-alcohol phosphatidyltransferase family protein [Clostridia bacterium]|nr:CDP-alcohol phosphatidyltransferase family protein [Clostridia bacterium]